MAQILWLSFFLPFSGSLHPDHVTQQQRAFMCAAEVWAENEERLPSAQVPPAENANTHSYIHTHTLSLNLNHAVSSVPPPKDQRNNAYMLKLQLLS